MKTWTIVITALLLFIGSFSSCIMDIDKELPDCPVVTPDEPIHVTASLFCNEEKTPWPESTHIGVIMLKGNTDQFVYPDRIRRYCLSASKGELFLPYASEFSVCRPQEGTLQDATGVYPHNTEVNDRLEVHFSVADQSDLQKLDLITARRTSGISHATDTVHIDYYRRLSQLQFFLTLTEVAPDGTRTKVNHKLAGSALQIDGMNLNGVYSLTTDQLTTSSPDALDANMKADGQTGQAIVFPRPAGKGVAFTVTVPQYPDTVYTFYMDPELALQSSLLYKFNLDLEYRTHVKPDERFYKVDYRFEGEANASTVSVYKEGTTTPWNLNETLSIKENNPFSFSYTSNLKVTVKRDNGEVLQTASGQTYTFPRITSNMTLIISAPKADPPVPPVPPAPTYYKMTYELDQTANGITVTGNGGEWEENGIISILAGNDFTFAFTPDQTLSAVSVTMNGKIVDGLNIANQSETFTNVNQDMHFILYGKAYHTVTLSISLPDEQSESNTLKLEGEEYVYTPPTGVDVIVKCNGETVSPDQSGVYRFSRISKNLVITVTKKQDNDPDLIIKADVHKWTERPVIDGGIITPDK